MSLLDDLAIDGADRLERRLGKRAALGTLAPVLDSMADSPGRARVHLRVLTLSAGLDPVRFELLVTQWESVTHGVHRDLKRAVATLLSGGDSRSAATLSAAELVRTKGAYDEASAAYLFARSLEASGDPKALGIYDRAALLADGQPRLRDRARVRAMRLSLDRDDAARRAEQLIPLDQGTPIDRLAVAVAALSASGRYRRAAAIDVLGELINSRRGVDAEVSRHALARVARHAENSTLSAIELDRVRAVLAQTEKASALEALEGLHEIRGLAVDGDVDRTSLRARAVMEGLAPGPRPLGGRALVGWMALSIVHACRERRVNEARGLLREASAMVTRGARIEASLWTAAMVSIGVAPERSRALTEALLQRREGEPPPHGYLPMADAWLARGEKNTGLRLLRCAARVREPGARSRLAARLRTEGWGAAARGERERAISLLREAKHLAG